MKDVLSNNTNLMEDDMEVREIDLEIVNIKHMHDISMQGTSKSSGREGCQVGEAEIAKIVDAATSELESEYMLPVVSK